MPKIIKNGTIHYDNWIVLAEHNDFSCLPIAPLICALDLWQQHRQQLLAHANHNSLALGLCLATDSEIELIHNDLAHFALLAINFAIFSDGRGYSLAALLRQQFDYQGELRAQGDVLRDQLFYLHRVGFDSFALRADQNLEEALSAFTDFSCAYQHSTDRKDGLSPLTFKPQ